MAAIYSAYITGAAKAISDFSNSKNKVSDSQIQKDVNDLFEFENELEKVIIKSVCIQYYSRTRSFVLNVYLKKIDQGGN